jgi:cytidylate kinase
VAIDGPSGAGKSTVARGLAAALGYAYVDTGALYRTIAWLADEHGVDWEAPVELAALVEGRSFSFDSRGELVIDGEPVGNSIRTPRISRGASAVARHPEVRAALLAIQRTLGRDGGVVLEGRDIGTVVFPDAEVKFFLEASVSVRARRRYDELVARGEEVTRDEVERDQIARDENDTRRAISPLRKANDAQVIDCDLLTAREVVELMESRVRASFPLTFNNEA